MKTRNKNCTLVLTSIILLVSLVTSCKKKQDDTITPVPVANGTAMLHLHTNVDDNEISNYDSVYVLTGGRKIAVTIAQLYISGIQLIKTDGSAYDLTGVNIIKTMQVEEYLLGSVPAGNYKSIRFNVGLSPATNAATPASNDSILNKPNMWFGSVAQPSGYVFVNFQGKIDTSAAANNTLAQMQQFKYRIGTNIHLKAVSLPDQNYTVIPNQTQYIHLTIDYHKLFNGIMLNINTNLNINTATDNAGALADQIANNIPLMFRYE